MMRKLFAFNMVSLDGFFEGPDHDISWHTVDDAFNRFAVEQLLEVDTLVFGRVTYELMADYWPTSAAEEDDPVVAGLMNKLPKIVVSRTLGEAGWNNTRILSADIKDGISEIKQQHGRDIALFGSAKLLSSLMQLNLVDEYRIMVSPVLLGSGTTLFQGAYDRRRLRLVKVRPFENGNVLLNYTDMR